MNPDPSPQAEPQISVVVPVHNEADNIRPLIDEIVTALDGGSYHFEIVYVDDASTDATPTRLIEARGGEPRLRVLRHAACAGQSAAVVTGVTAARGRFIATLDGDGQNDPADIPSLLARLEATPDPDRMLVAGWRQKRKDTPLKRLSSKIANAVRSGLLNDATPDTGCGLKTFTRAAFLNMPAFNHMHRFLPALMIRSGGEVVSVPVNHRARERGISKYGMWDRLWVGIFDLLGVMWLKTRPVKPVIETDSGAP